jgi:ketosteroid isomerase-like protein
MRRGLTRAVVKWHSPPISAEIESLIHEYAHRYTALDADGVTRLCLAPFLAVRSGTPIHMADRDAVRDHFASMMQAYRSGGAATWSPIEIDVHQLGEQSAFATVRWNALDEEGQVVRDTKTTYHLLVKPEGWRLLSYTNHF